MRVKTLDHRIGDSKDSWAKVVGLTSTDMAEDGRLLSTIEAEFNSARLEQSNGRPKATRDQAELRESRH